MPAMTGPESRRYDPSRPQRSARLPRGIMGEGRKGSEDGADDRPAHAPEVCAAVDASADRGKVFPRSASARRWSPCSVNDANRIDKRGSPGESSHAV